MTTLTWHKGPPPHRGWWATDYAESGLIEWRWRSDEWWSWVVRTADTPQEIDRYAAKQETRQDQIRWCDYWPPNARVARINPDTGEVTGAGPMPCEVQA